MDYECPTCASTHGVVLGQQIEFGCPLIQCRCKRCGDFSWWEQSPLPVLSPPREATSKCVSLQRCSSHRNNWSSSRPPAALHGTPCRSGCYANS
jgi:hypothetical protein